MKTGKLIAIVITGVLILMMAYMIVQDVSSSSSNENKRVEQKAKDPAKNLAKRFEQPKSDEDKKLEELKKLASNIEVQNKSNTYLVKCSSCHGRHGEGTQVAPGLQGKSIDYMLSKLDDYRNDRVKNSLMRGLLTNTSDEELASLALEISKF